MVRKKVRQGWDCETQEDGSQSCKRIEQNAQGKKVATGTEVNVAVDPETCQPVLTGNRNEIMDEDAGAIKEISERVTKKCRDIKGL